jgi:hypothetical protein
VQASGSGSGSTDSGGASKSSLLAVSGFVTGVLILIAFVAEGMSPNFPSPTQANWSASSSDLALWAFRSYAWGLFAVAAIPFFAVLGRAFRSRSAEGALAATLLSSIGVVLYAARAILQDAGWAAAGTIAAPSATAAAYQFNLLYAVTNPLLPLGAALYGVGFILFGILAWRSGILPSWLTVVAFVGGVAGWLLFPVINSNGQFIGYFFTETLVPFTTAIWSFGCGAIFLRRARLTGRSGA